MSGDTHELLALGSNRLIPPQLLGVAAAIEVKRIVEMPLPADGFVVVVAFRGGQPFEAFGVASRPGDCGVRSGRRVSAPRTMAASRVMASILYVLTMASNEHSSPWWPSSAPVVS